MQLFCLQVQTLIYIVIQSTWFISELQFDLLPVKPVCKKAENSFAVR